MLLENVISVFKIIKCFGTAVMFYFSGFSGDERNVWFYSIGLGKWGSGRCCNV